MYFEFVSAIAQVRPTETWTGGSVAAAIVLFGLVMAALVAWAVRVASRR